MKIDLGAKVVSRKQSIWVVFPGKNRIFLDDFYRLNRIFLQLPGLAAERVDLTAADADRQLVRRIRRSFALDNYHNEINRGHAAPRPSEKLIDYSDSPDDGRINSMLGCVKSLLTRMNVGDLVVVPGMGSYSQVLFGEITAPFSKTDTVVLDRFAGDAFNARTVEWVRVVEEKRALPKSIAKAITRPPAIHKIPRDVSADEIFGFAYDTFLTHDRAEITVRAPEYSGRNPTEVFEFIKFMAAIAAICNAAKVHSKNQTFPDLSLDEIILRYSSGDNFADYAYSFSSPGFIRGRPYSRALAISMAAAVALSLNGLSACSRDTDIYATNAQGKLPPEIQKDVDQTLKFMTNSMTERQKKELETLARTADDKVSVQTTAKVIPEAPNEAKD